MNTRWVKPPQAPICKADTTASAYANGHGDTRANATLVVMQMQSDAEVRVLKCLDSPPEERGDCETCPDRGMCVYIPGPLTEGLRIVVLPRLLGESHVSSLRAGSRCSSIKAIRALFTLSLSLLSPFIAGIASVQMLSLPETR